MIIDDADREPVELEVEYIISEVTIILQNRTLSLFNTTDNSKNAEMARNTSKYILRRVLDKFS